MRAARIHARYHVALACNRPVEQVAVAEAGEGVGERQLVDVLEEGDALIEAIVTDGTQDLIVAKNRNGPVGDVKMAFFNSHMRFESLTRQ